MWGAFGLGLLVTTGVLVVLLVACRLAPARFGRGSRWGARLSEPGAAERRSQALLRELLSEPQYHQLLTAGYVEVPSPSRAGRVYRIPSTGGLVTVYEHGCASMRLCLQSTEPLPRADVVVMHKLLIEANEQEYLHQANQLPVHIQTVMGGLLTFRHV